MSKCEQCIVRQMSSLKSLSSEELRSVSACKTTRFYKKGDIIFDEGETLHGIYCVRSGVCKLTKLSANGKDQTVKLLGKGEILGQRSLISDERTNLSAVALNNIELCFVPKDQIITPLNDNKNFSMDVLKGMAKDLREAEDDIINMAQKSVKQRLAETLLHIQNTFGTDADGALNIILSREDYASIVGTATESAIRILSQFKKEGLITTSGKHIKIKDPEGLKRVE
ncbi:Crp/Fnr family transcriptional regulator [Bizionia sediminis]|uniref:Crp/Fnr family transcriptional regulator n=1 Tax=Bizionia sediminis TaxID=1737064 RepID=A0ABW5KQM5_9FLAO